MSESAKDFSGALGAVCFKSAMLVELSISDVVLIDQLDLSLGSGLTAMTGETGAGKSIVLDALGLALGKRADRALVRAGATQAKVTAIFAIEADHPAQSLLAEQEMQMDADEDLILRRTVTIDGKSRAFINDIPVSAALLRQLGDVLVEVHGQHDGRGLMDAGTHINCLDDFGNLGTKIASCRHAWKSWREAQKMQADLLAQANMDASEQEYLQEANAEIDRLDPQPGEEQSLAAMRGLMMQTEKLQDDIRSATTALEAGPAMDGQLGSAIRFVEQALRRFEPQTDGSLAQTALAQSLSALEQTMLALEEAGTALDRASREMVLEPAQLEQAEERLFALRALARKHQVQVEQLGDVQRDLTQRLTALENLEQAQAQAKAKVETTKAKYLQLAQNLSKARAKTAKKLDTAILAELAPLRLEKAIFKTQISLLALDDGQANGMDQVRFEISANPGTPLGPLASIASGGELSRISLAIKAALAGQGGSAVLVFDEIDQGVGGAVADAVGRRLAALSKTSQVWVITHSPQVAARADSQFRIEKSDQNDVSRTDVVLLNPAEREEEIARMLAGAKITEQAREAARALLG
ncbi:DNA repair protein RecN [hydrothermal vent metagenome]|uniref:DNA repair protein RecN n=1 Tax=hydrothermal vent metagenome TaxID=652676 RepID=A0A3B0RDG1_9ZZZZ